MILKMAKPFLLLFLLGACNNSTPDRTIETVETGWQPIIIDSTYKRKALVVGIADYDYTDDLKTTTNDAEDIADILRKLNFEVSEYTNPDQNDLRKAIDKFGNNLKENDIALFFYAGHGIQAMNAEIMKPALMLFRVATA